MMAPETVVVDHNKSSPQQAPPQQQQQQGGALDWIKINIDYFKTPPGLLKIIQLVSQISTFNLKYYRYFDLYNNKCTLYSIIITSWFHLIHVFY